MLDLSPEAIAFFLLRLPVILLALTVHEWAHAWSAWRLGDPTARNLGRVSLNPLHHLEPIGTLCMLFGPIGWAKPVPVNPFNLRNPSRDDVIVSAAGPLSNLAQAVLFALLLNLPWRDWAWSGPARTVFEARGLQQLAWALWIVVSVGVRLNVGLALFNLLPLYPLDGHHIARENLRGQARQWFESWQHYGIFILGGLVMLNYYGIRGIHPITWPINQAARLLTILLAGSPTAGALNF